MKKTINFFDLFLAVLILVTTFWAFRHLSHPDGKQRYPDISHSLFLKITTDDKNVNFIPLPSGNEILYHSVKPGFKIEMSSYGVRVVESDCLHKICRHTGRITLGGTIVCVPNKIILKIVCDKGEEGILLREKYDSITR